MNLYNFDTSKMTWTKQLMQGTGTSFVEFQFSDETYFRSLENIFLNLRNNTFKLFLVKKDGNQSFILGDIFIVNWDVINNNPKFNNLSLSTFKIIANVLTISNNLTNITDYWLYLQYE